MKERQNHLVTAVIVGAGNRSLTYASYAEMHPDELQIVGVVDPVPSRQKRTAERFGFPMDRCFNSVEEFVAAPKFADTVINGTMDHLHVKTTLPLLRAGYDVLLEKPIGTSMEEVNQLLEEANRWERKVVICHVLRYAPFYLSIRQHIENDEIGDIVNIQTAEHVCYPHMAVGYIRGKWNSLANCHSTMLMAKCCHDLDIIAWMKKGVKPAKVSSFGGLTEFRPEKAPAGSGKRCLVDCQIEDQCPYSARKQYLNTDFMDMYAFDFEHLGPNPTKEQKEESLRNDNPYGRCVWHCDNDVVDHQSVMMEFEDGSTATHNMVGGSARPIRTIFIVGTKGEIQGVMEDGTFIIRKLDATSGLFYTEDRYEVDVKNSGHGGGDMPLVRDFVRAIRGETPSLSLTSLERSLYSHQIGFSADRARLENKVVVI